MASKRFKGKLCVYCCKNEATTGDHVFAREFFLKKHRDNLPKAPACFSCNNEKSQLEHYLTSLLPFAGRHKDASENLSEHILKRLNKNKKLHRSLSQNQLKVTLMENGINSQTTALPIKGGAIETLFESIVKGLAWHHWNVYLPTSYPIEILSLTDTGKKFFQDYLFSMQTTNRELINLGAGTVIYEGIQGVDTPEITVWRFHMYGGMLFSSSSGELSNEIGAISGPSEIMAI